ncbi:cellulose-binding protein [Xylariomycetidae sp. FL2044]|nr:cellulose-binding protein [Xylariomycetidae sp. FL2044]
MKAIEALTLGCLVGTAWAQTKLRIMPLGDSITEITCWRSKLWDMLKAANVTDQIEFVGSMTNNPQNCQAEDANWDKHHEGHSGFLAINIANSLLEGWLAEAKPDVVMFMLGTNDVAQGRTVAAIISSYSLMVDLMRASNPNMKIIVDTVIPLPMANTNIQAINAEIPSWAAELNTTESPIYINDVYPYPNSDLRDGVHPNDAGDDIIANTLNPLLTWVITSSSAVNETEGATAPVEFVA